MSLLRANWLVIESSFAIVAAPIAGVLIARRGDRATGRLLMLAAVVFAAGCALHAVLARERGWIAMLEAQAVVASAVLALSAIGACAAIWFNDVLDAAGLSLAIALLLGAGVFIGGGPLADASTAALNAALLASPIVSVTAAADIDLFRSAFLYERSPVAHRLFSYPAWYAAAGLYLSVAAVMLGGWHILRRRMKRVIAIAVVALIGAASPVSADVSVRIRSGRITIVAKNATLRQILTEWARVGHTKIVNAERVAGEPLSLELNDVPEPQALELLLRALSGYAATERTPGASTDSVYDVVIVMPTTAARPASASPAVSSPAPLPFAAADVIPAPAQAGDNAAAIERTEPPSLAADEAAPPPNRAGLKFPQLQMGPTAVPSAEPPPGFGPAAQQSRPAQQAGNAGNNGGANSGQASASSAATPGESKTAPSGGQVTRPGIVAPTAAAPASTMPGMTRQQTQLPPR